MSFWINVLREFDLSNDIKSLKELAYFTGIPYSRIAKAIERGSAVSAIDAYYIAMAFNKPFEYFLDFSVTTKRSSTTLPQNIPLPDNCKKLLYYFEKLDESEQKLLIQKVMEKAEKKT